jgi:RNA-binding protein
MINSIALALEAFCTKQPLASECSAIVIMDYSCKSIVLSSICSYTIDFSTLLTKIFGRTMKLSTKQKQHLKGLAHHLKPVVLLGANGLTEAVLAEIEIALDHHELIKVKVAAEDRETKGLIIDAIVRETEAEKVQSIGKVLVLYRPSEERKIELPRK